MTSDLGRVTTHRLVQYRLQLDCGDVRSRTSYNEVFNDAVTARLDCGDVRSRTSYNFSVNGYAYLYKNCGDVRSRTSYNPASLAV